MSSRRTKALMVVGVFIACLVAVIVFLAFYKPFWLVRLVQRIFPEVAFFVDTDSQLVALTLDDGPDDSVTPEVLSILNREGIPATWFVMGERVKQYPETYSQLLLTGQQVANHFWDNTPVLLMGKDRFRRDLARTEGLIKQRVNPKLFRPAYSWFRPWALDEARRLNYRLVLGSVYASDAWRPPRAYLRWAISKMARPGAIIVLHVGPGRNHTIDILPDIVRRIHAKGLSFVTLEELMSSRKAV